MKKESLNVAYKGCKDQGLICQFFRRLGPEALVNVFDLLGDAYQFY